MENELLHKILDKLDSMDTDIKGEIAGIKTEITSIKTELAGQKGEIAGIKAEISGIKGELSALNNRFTVLEEKSEKQFKTLHDGQKTLYQIASSLRDEVEVFRELYIDHNARILRIEKNRIKKELELT